MKPLSLHKLNLGLLTTIALEVVPFLTYAPFPALLSFLNASWKSCSVRLSSTACDSVSMPSVIKMAAFQFYIHSGEHRKVGCVGANSHAFFLSKSPLVKKVVLS
jgi:hypothetical protein